MRLLLYLFIGFACVFEHAKSSQCENKMCPGPKFTQSYCCPGFVCVSTTWSHSPNHLVCINHHEHLRIFSINDILERAENARYKRRAQGGNQNLPLVSGIDNRYQHKDYSGFSRLRPSKQMADFSAGSDLENDPNSAAYDEVDDVPMKVKRNKQKILIKSNRKKIEMKHHKSRKREEVIKMVNRSKMPIFLRNV